MISIIPKAIEDYASGHSTPEPRLLKELARRTYAEMEIPQMQVGHLEGSFLKFVVEVSRAKKILEIGTFTGYSALVMAMGMPAGGRLITCDIDPEATSIAREFWKKSPHGKKIELRLGPALETIPTVKGPLDLVFIDADKENYIRYWELSVPKLRRGGILLVDNVLWGGRVLRPTDRTDHAITRFNRHVAEDKRVEALVLTVRDGITFARKK